MAKQTVDRREFIKAIGSSAAVMSAIPADAFALTVEESTRSMAQTESAGGYGQNPAGRSH